MISLVIVRWGWAILQYYCEQTISNATIIDIEEFFDSEILLS